ncbi:ATP-binding protein [Empedobacter sp. UBA5637]|uniref:ATP-binding protein n=1 Tax=Empedobacter sp. UBA5637 TaxID=1946442 RepID=UPI0025B80824|nr:ATP-binding protein [Empedobacter sp. UBA5637]
MTNLTQIQRTTDIPQAMQRFLDERGVKQPEIVKLSGVNKATVNLISRGIEFNGNTRISDKYYKQIANAIGLKLEKAYWQHFNTFNFKQAILTFENARKNKERRGIDGDTGLGKTYAATAFKKKYPAIVTLVKCDEVANTKEFVIAMAEQVKASTIGTKNTILKAVVKKLKEKDEAFLIIDEFENSKKGIIPVIKYLADELEGVVPVVVLGIDVEKMLSKSAEKRKQGFIQVNRRWSFGWTFLNQDITEDITSICESVGIERKTVINWLTARVKDFDSLKNIITTALIESEKSEEPITTEMLNELFAN